MSGFIAMPTIEDVGRLERRINLLERQARLPELREELAIHVHKGVLTAAAIEANARLRLPLDLATAEVFVQIVVDVINRGRS